MKCISPAVVVSSLSLCLAGNSFAGAMFSGYADVTDTQSQTIISYGSQDGALSTNGSQSVSAGVASASINAFADPINGIFKSLSRAAIARSNSNPFNIAYAGADFHINDTITLTGPAATASLTVTLSYDSIFSGLNIDPLLTTNDTATHFLYAESTRFVNYSYPNPNFNPDCLNSESCSRDEFNQFISDGGSHILDSYLDAVTGSFATNYSVSSDGRYTGQAVFTFSLPTNVPVALQFDFSNLVECYNVNNACNIAVDASNSDYIGISTENGVTFTSSNGFQYLGLPTNAVPIPATFWLVSIGIIGLVATKRQRRLVS